MGFLIKSKMCESPTKVGLTTNSYLFFTILIVSLDHSISLVRWNEIMKIRLNSYITHLC